GCELAATAELCPYGELGRCAGSDAGAFSPRTSAGAVNGRGVAAGLPALATGSAGLWPLAVEFAKGAGVIASAAFGEDGLSQRPDGLEIRPTGSAAIVFVAGAGEIAFQEDAEAGAGFTSEVNCIEAALVPIGVEAR